MQRRTLLGAVGTLLGGVAGCLGGPAGNSGTPTDANSPTQTDEHTATDTPTPGSTPSPTPSISPSFQVVDRGCGEGANEATITFDEPITVAGTIAGPNTCYTAELQVARIEDRELVIQVAAVKEETDGTVACGECIVDVEYDLTVEVSGPQPRQVTVAHDSMDGVDTVAQVER